ncbi:ABC transporter permease [Haloglycomyces albus]|uniref:ABC transporter permease n=1 Tax=Haloglycomyces albus TaxID=526067 RepID=UPI00046D6061|nr:ABC transporter permease [Haloglycomyces albus]
MSNNVESPDTQPAENGGSETDGSPKRPTFGQTFFRYLTEANGVMVTVYSLLLAFFIGAILIIVSDPTVRGTWSYFFTQPSDALTASWSAVASAYTDLFKGSVIDFADLGAFLRGEQDLSQVVYPMSETLTYATPLIFTGLAVGLAFKAGLFNIGAQGQFVIGMLSALVVGFALNLPLILHLPLALLAGALAGGLLGAVPGYLKAKTGAHEVISSIMLNNIVGFFLVWAIGTPLIHSLTSSQLVSKSADESARLPQLLSWLGPQLRVSAGILLGLVVAAVMWWLLEKSTFGYRIRAVGSNSHASETAGMNVGRTFTTTMGVGGLLAGLGGAVLVLGLDPYRIDPGTAVEYGFDGITVALLGRAHPGGIVAAALLFGALKSGTLYMQPAVPTEMSTLLQAIIVLFIAAPALVKTLLHLRTPAGGLTTLEARGW